MTYFGVTQASADWLLGKPGVLDALFLAFRDPEVRGKLTSVEIAEGPIRITAAGNADLIIFWHADYLSGTGNEDWGFINISNDLGIFADPEISREVFERALYVVNQRLQGFFIEGAFIHRSHANGTHTCLAGRGSDARRESLAYMERDVATASGAVHSLICVGPTTDIATLALRAGEEGRHLPTLVADANSQIDPARKRQVAPNDMLPQLRASLAAYFEAASDREYREVSVATGEMPITDRDSYRSIGWTYSDWLSKESSLSAIQRRLLTSDALERHPIRIVGPGGSGKTLLMQLLALRQLDLARQRARPLRLLYLVHNVKMAEAVRHRFSILQGASADFTDGDRVMDIQTLSEYGRRELGLAETQIIDPDAYEAKEFQYEIVGAALDEVMKKNADLVAKGPLLREVRSNEALRPIMTRLLMAEISTAIKGHGLTTDEKRYVQSERRLSRLHGVLNLAERKIVFEIFRRYHSQVFEGFRVLDSDDVALSLLGRLRAPIWELKRRDLGFDYVFVDEAQLFNENERRILPLLTKSSSPHVPIVLALDEAQDIFGQSTAGLAALGIENVTSESLTSIHRSTRAIVRLAFFVIQQSTDLFGPDFPDFTGIADVMEEDNSPLASPPTVEVIPEAQERIGRFVLKRIRSLRKANLWRIAVICYAEQFWPMLLSELRTTDLPLRVLENRGERLPASEPVVALTRPAFVGGQEFDAVILVGLEEGIVPPRVSDNDALAAAVEQQALREIYVGVTRARYQLKILLSTGALLSPVLAQAERAGLLVRDS
jgi:hypothetical protein